MGLYCPRVVIVVALLGLACVGANGEPNQPHGHGGGASSKSSFSFRSVGADDDPFKEDGVGGMEKGKTGCDSFIVSVLTLNLWDSLAHAAEGSRIDDLASLIGHLKVDVAVLQEVDQKTLDAVTEKLGLGWKNAFLAQDPKKPIGIITNMPIEKVYDFAGVGRHLESPNMLGVKITRGSQSFRVFNAFFPELSPPIWKRLSSYSAIKRAKRALERDQHRQGIYPALTGFLNSHQADHTLPTIFAGSLNQPSSLDHTYEATSEFVEARGGALGIYDWPASRELLRHGFVDTFREQYPTLDSTANFGFTYPDAPRDDKAPKDRVDYIYVRNSISKHPTERAKWQIMSSNVIKHLGFAKPTDHKPWFSNHFGVFTVLRYKDAQPAESVPDENPSAEQA